MRVHLVYPQAPGSVVAPWTIGSHLLSALVEAGHSVSWSDWDDVRAPVCCDLLIGHPHPEPGRSWELAATCADRVIAICPWGGGADATAMLDRYESLWHRALLICGPEWARQIPARWRATPLDMAVEASHWPEIDAIGPQHRALYVGCTLPSKGADYLAEISMASSELEIMHVGPGQCGGRVRELGMAPNGLWRLIAPQFSAIVSCGRNDANATSILEGVALGLSAFTTIGAGWGEDIATRIPDDDPAAAAEIVLSTPRVSRANVVRERYGWGRFIETVMEAVNG